MWYNTKEKDIILKKVVNFRPILFFAFAVIVGILSVYFVIFNKIYVTIILCALSIIFLALAIVLSKNHKKRYVIFAIIFVIILLLSGLNFGLRINAFSESEIDGITLNFTGNVKEIKEYSNSERIIIENVSYDGVQSGKLNGKISLFVYGATDFDLGDKLEFSTEVYLSDLTNANGFNSTNVTENIKYSGSVDALDLNKIGNEQTVFQSVHKFIRDSLKTGLSEKPFTIAYALLLGNTDYMQEDLLSNFRSLGVAHIFAVSGLHIGFFATFLAWIFSKIKINRFVKLIITSIILFFYAGVCGFTASSVRAAIMATVLLSAEVVGKKYDRLSSVAFAAIIVLAYAPTELFRVGFQLSFVVVLGIIISSRTFQKLFKFTGKKISELLGGVLSAQLFSIPICILTFGEISIISIVANLLILPVIGVFYIFLFLLTIIGGTFGIFGITLFLPNLVLKGVSWLVTAFDYTVFMVGGITIGIFTISYYLSFIFEAGYFNFKKITNLIVSLSLCLITVAGTVVFSLQDARLAKSYVIADDKFNGYVIKEGDECSLFVASASDGFSNYHIDLALNKLRVNSIDNVIFLESEKEMELLYVLFPLSEYNFKNVFYFDKTDKGIYGLLNFAFKDKNIFPVYDEEIIKLKSISFNYFVSGYGVDVKVKNKTVKVFSDMPSTEVDFGSANTSLSDLIILYDYHDIISTKYNSKKFISFTINALFDDAYKNRLYPCNFK